MKLDESADGLIPGIFGEMVRNKDRNFANARDVRKLFEHTITLQSNRLQKIYNMPGFDKEELVIIRSEDLKINV